MDLRSAEHTDVGADRRGIMVTAALFAAVAGLAALDLVNDLDEGTSLRHAVVEALIVVAAAAGLVVLLRRLARVQQRERDAHGRALELAQALDRSREENARWRAEAKDLVAGLGTMIGRQFGRWGLTAAEREVALLLLKGLSHKEVAASRSISEATARQQAASVYRKAGLSGRHDLAAFFLEDLLAPRTGD